MRIRTKGFPILAIIIAALIATGILTAPPGGRAQVSNSKAAVSARTLTVPAKALTGVLNQSNSTQDASQPAPAPSPAAKPVELPDGDGKPIATEYCQMCHKLTNLTKAHKNLDDWKDTIHTMIDRGATVPDDKIDSLAEYLAKNFGPKDSAPAGSSPASISTATPPSSDAASGAPAAAKPVELPDGNGKEIATENCQACHKLTNLTKAHKSLDDWKDTVQTMIERGANVPPEKLDILVQYLAKNFGPKDASAPASSTPSTPAQ